MFPNDSATGWTNDKCGPVAPAPHASERLPDGHAPARDALHRYIFYSDLRLPCNVFKRNRHENLYQRAPAAIFFDSSSRYLIPFPDRNDMNLIIPAKAGIQTTRVRSAWIPAFAGMTMVDVLRWKRKSDGARTASRCVGAGVPAIKRWLRRGASSRASPLLQRCVRLVADQAFSARRAAALVSASGSWCRTARCPALPAAARAAPGRR